MSRLDDEKESEAHSALCPRPTQEEDALGAETIESNWTVYAQLVRFFLHFGHHAVILRCDDEPSTVALANSPMKSLRSFGATCKLELGNHQGNGAAEAIGMCFLQRVEAGGTRKPTFGAYRPTAWCLVHASWIRDRYATSFGQPA